jgi:hypothetical protein
VNLEKTDDGFLRAGSLSKTDRNGRLVPNEVEFDWPMERNSYPWFSSISPSSKSYLPFPWDGRSMDSVTK